MHLRVGTRLQGCANSHTARAANPRGQSTLHNVCHRRGCKALLERVTCGGVDPGRRAVELRLQREQLPLLCACASCGVPRVAVAPYAVCHLFSLTPTQRCVGAVLATRSACVRGAVIKNLGPRLRMHMGLYGHAPRRPLLLARWCAQHLTRAAELRGARLQFPCGRRVCLQLRVSVHVPQFLALLAPAG